MVSCLSLKSVHVASKKLRVLIVLVLSIWVGFSVLFLSLPNTTPSAGPIDEAKDDLTPSCAPTKYCLVCNAGLQFEVGKNVRHQLMVQNAPAALKL